MELGGLPFTGGIDVKTMVKEHMNFHKK
jgi:hypothetical protein